MTNQMSDSKQFGYGILVLCGIFGIGLLILSRGDGFSIILGVILVLIGLSPLFHSFYQSWNESKES